MDLNSQKQQLITARYGEKDQPAGLQWNNQIAGILAHRSVRNFAAKSLPDYWFETLVAAAQSAPTSSNLQQWSVVAITDPLLKAKVRALAAGDAGLANSYIEQAPAILLWVADLSRNQYLATSDNLTPQVHDYLDSLITASVDAAIAAQNATIAAESLGLGTVYIGATRNKAKELAALIQLPAQSYVVCGLVVGWPKDEDNSSIRPRLPQRVIAHVNGYQPGNLNQDISNYEETFQSFRAQLGMKDKTWKQAAQHAATSLAYMDGRQDLKATLEQLGFGLK